MKRRRWLFWFFGALCALTLAIGYLARPEDELAGIMRLHPYVESGFPPGKVPEPGEDAKDYYFTTPIKDVLAALPGQKRAAVQGYLIALPSGRFARLIDPAIRERGETCVVWVFGSGDAWYLQTWRTIKRRLGIVGQ